VVRLRRLAWVEGIREGTQAEAAVRRPQACIQAEAVVRRPQACIQAEAVVRRPQACIQAEAVLAIREVIQEAVLAIREVIQACRAEQLQVEAFPAMGFRIVCAAKKKLARD